MDADMQEAAGDVEHATPPLPPSEAASLCHLLPSPFPGRPPTLWVERPQGQPPRASLPTLAFRGAAPHVRMELNANSVRNGLKRAGFKVVKSVGSVRLLWARHTGDKLWTQLPRGAIVNHFPGSWVLGRKDGLAKSLHAQQRRLGALGMGEAYSFFPRTFILPQDRPSLERAVERGVLRGGGTLIVKPQNSSRGRGIRLVSSVAEVRHAPSFSSTAATITTALPPPRPPPPRPPPPRHQVPPEERLLVQEYIDQPMLLEGKKFDIRLCAAPTPSPLAPPASRRPASSTAWRSSSFGGESASLLTAAMNSSLVR